MLLTILLVGIFTNTSLGIIWSSKNVLDLFIKMFLLSLAFAQTMVVFGIIV